VRPEPEAQTAATGRERVIDLLKAAFVQGRLTRDELDARVGRALESRTGADLAAVTADLPAELIGALPRVPSRRRIPMNTAVTAGAGATLAANLGMMAAIMAGSPVAVVLMALFTVVAITAAIGAMIVAR
jgi:hypothetical protein